MEFLVDGLLKLTESMGHLGVFVLMAVESSFIPFPSEIVVPPAAALAAQGKMNIWLVVLNGILGSLLGASINYFLARSLGRSIVYYLIEHKIAKFLLLSKAKLEKSEKHFLKYGAISTFIGRLIPAVRQLISIPAGFVKMPYWSFLFFTFLGAGLWVVILAALGYYWGANQEVLEEYYGEITLIFIGLAVLLILAFLLRNWLKASKSVE